MIIEIPRAQTEIKVKLLEKRFLSQGPCTPHRATPAKDELTVKNYKPYEETNHNEGEPTDTTSKRISQIRIRGNKIM